MMEDWKIYSEGIDHYDRGNFEAAFGIFEMLAKDGHTESMSMLASMYCAGQFVPKDIAVSIGWDKKAIGQGSTTSLANLATTYSQTGQLELAEKWFLRAISTGDGDAMLDLAKIKVINGKSTNDVKELLQKAIASSSITDQSKEEALEILRQLEK